MIRQLIDVVVIISMLVVFSACQNRSTPESVVDETTFSQPTASELFNLRSRCAELGEKINGEYDLTGISLATGDDLPYPLKVRGTNGCHKRPLERWVV